MGFLADKTVFSPLTKEILEESISFSCGNEDLDGFFHNDAVSYADNLFGISPGLLNHIIKRAVVIW